MDPHANLAEQITLAHEIINLTDNNAPVPEETADRLAELVLALDEWRRKGGWDPYSVVIS